MVPLKQARRIVIKIGSTLLVEQSSGVLRQDWLQGLAVDIAQLHRRGCDVVLVSSGSIALGRLVLGLSATMLSLVHNQAAAAVGQIRLARAYEQVLYPQGIKTAQILLTLDDSSDRRRYLNARQTLNMLLNYGVVPIVNENDTVATDEIRFGDNDRLAAQVTSMVSADLLILLSDVDGLYSGDPRQSDAVEHRLVVEKITPEIEKMAGGAGSCHSSGGMRTKLMAAKIAMASGCDMIIMYGNVISPLKTLLKGAKHTLFKAQSNPHLARKQWILAMKAKGTLIIDAGAQRALGQGKSLLPAGVVRIVGNFSRGDSVRVVNAKDRELAKGLIVYGASEVRSIVGRQSHEIEFILGYKRRSVLIHRDDMVV